MFDLQKKSNFYRMRLRNVDREVEPFFSGLLVVLSCFMSVLLFGAGSFFARAAISPASVSGVAATISATRLRRRSARTARTFGPAGLEAPSTYTGRPCLAS